MGSPEFDQWDRFAPPFGLILYYIYNFIIIVILLNVLIALYNSAYEDVTDNAIDEYLALFSQKTLQFVRAPDENVFIAPFNLVELFGLVLPFEWWMSDKQYARLNDYVMGVLYSPLLLITAYLETRTARTVRFNRKRNEADDDTIEEWEQMAASSCPSSSQPDITHGSAPLIPRRTRRVRGLCSSSCWSASPTTPCRRVRGRAFE